MIPLPRPGPPTRRAQVLYHVVEASSGFRYTRHNAAPTFLLAYILPNGLWIVVPAAAAWTLAKALAASPRTKGKAM